MHPEKNVSPLKATPISCVAPSSRSRLEAAMTVLFQQWAEHWLGANIRLSFEYSESLFARALHSQAGELYSCGNGFLCLFSKAFTALALAEQVLDFDGVSGVTQADESVLKGMHLDCLNSLIDSLSGSVEPPSGQDDIKMFPSVSVSLEIGKLKLVLHFDKEALLGRGWVQAAVSDTELTPREQLVLPLQAQVEASLSSVSLRLDQLLQLKPGHILKLDHPLDKPLTLTCGEKSLPVKSYLIKKQRHKALLLAK